MCTVNFSLCQEMHDNMHDNNHFLTFLSSNVSIDVCQNISNISYDELAQIESYMSAFDDGCALLTRLLHAALISSDIDKELINQFVEFAVESGVLS